MQDKNGDDGEDNGKAEGITMWIKDMDGRNDESSNACTVVAPLRYHIYCQNTPDGRRIV